MNKPIYEINNSFNLSQILNKNFDNENELKVDEVDNIPNNNINLKNSKNAFYLTEESYIKKHSLNLSTNKDSLSGNFENNDNKLFFDENSVQSIEGIKK